MATGKVAAGQRGNSRMTVCLQRGCLMMGVVVSVTMSVVVLVVIAQKYCPCIFTRNLSERFLNQVSAFMLSTRVCISPERSAEEYLGNDRGVEKKVELRCRTLRGRDTCGKMSRLRTQTANWVKIRADPAPTSARLLGFSGLTGSEQEKPRRKVFSLVPNAPICVL